MINHAVVPNTALNDVYLIHITAYCANKGKCVKFPPSHEKHLLPVKNS